MFTCLSFASSSCSRREKTSVRSNPRPLPLLLLPVILSWTATNAVAVATFAASMLGEGGTIVKSAAPPFSRSRSSRLCSDTMNRACAILARK